jgi:ABC-type lipoprotein release transport system permease subunit
VGFVRKQIFALVAWQATTIASVALLVGIPAGIILGRWAWNVFADQIAVVSQPVTALLPVLLTIPATLAVANLVALLPARIAARTQPAFVLRSE